MNMSENWKPIIERCRALVSVIEASQHVGSGLVISTNGFIITNKHVIEGQRSLFVSLYDGTRIKAVPVHSCEKSDLAIVKAVIHTEKYFELSPARLAENCEMGDEDLAIGHPRGLHWTPTTGIVSSACREMSEGTFVQTDVAINPGNSGGPLLDRLGRLIGINTFGMRESEGLNFAIPARQVFDFWQEFCEKAHKGEIIIPSDEEILQTEQPQNPVEMLHAAAELSRIRLRPEEDVGWWTAYTLNDNRFSVVVGESYLWMGRHIAEMSEGDLEDASLLRTMLRWQNDILGGPSFEIGEKNNLSLNCIRSSEDLNVSEIAAMLVAMSKAVDEYVVRLDEYFDRS